MDHPLGRHPQGLGQRQPSTAPALNDRWHNRPWPRRSTARTSPSSQTRVGGTSSPDGPSSTAPRNAPPNGVLLAAPRGQVVAWELAREPEGAHVTRPGRAQAAPSPPPSMYMRKAAD